MTRRMSLPSGSSSTVSKRIWPPIPVPGHAVAVVNGTAALHVALRLAGVREGDEVLIPALTFVATANVVTYCGATPHFVDSEERTLGLDSRVLREYLQGIVEIRNGQCVNRNTGRVIRALVPMHAFGHPVDIEGVLAVARDFRLALVEDAAESLGSTTNGRHTGTFGQMGVLSFNGNKTITTGGGGAILTDDPELARRAKHLTFPIFWWLNADSLSVTRPRLRGSPRCGPLWNPRIAKAITGYRRCCWMSRLPGNAIPF